MLWPWSTLHVLMALFDPELPLAQHRKLHVYLLSYGITYGRCWTVSYSCQSRPLPQNYLISGRNKGVYPTTTLHCSIFYSTPLPAFKVAIQVQMQSIHFYFRHYSFVHIHRIIKTLYIHSTYRCWLTLLSLVDSSHSSYSRKQLTSSIFLSRLSTGTLSTSWSSSLLPIHSNWSVMKFFRCGFAILLFVCYAHASATTRAAGSLSSNNNNDDAHFDISGNVVTRRPTQLTSAVPLEGNLRWVSGKPKGLVDGWRDITSTVVQKGASLSVHSFLVPDEFET